MDTLVLINIKRMCGYPMEKMFAPERRRIILEKLHERKRVTIKELSSEIKVSEATLRTDLSKLEEDGLLVRTHGGAILPEDLELETSFSIREQKNKDDKFAIASEAIKLIADDQCIMLDASSTALELAKILRDTPIRLTVVTSGINTALELNNHPDITVILLGGILKRGSYSLESSLGVSILNAVHIDMMFTSANGFSLQNGLTDFSVYEVELKKAMVKASQKVVALLDHTKMNKNSIASFASLDDIDLLITTSRMDDHDIKILNEHDVEILHVSSER